jgi:inorganic pyrophosphatase
MLACSDAARTPAGATPWASPRGCVNWSTICGHVTTEILCIVEIPKGSHGFPTDFGFVPETLGPDEQDPLDVMVAASEPTCPGGGVIARPVAVIALSDEGEIERKALCVPCEDPTWEHVGGLEDLPNQLIEEIGDFFVACKRREGREVRVAGWSSHQDAEEVIRQARARFRQNHPHDDDATADP